MKWFGVAAMAALSIGLAGAQPMRDPPSLLRSYGGQVRLANQLTFDPVRLEAFVDGVVRHAMAEQHLAGVSVAVVGPEGVALVKGYGVASLSSPHGVFPHPPTPLRGFGGQALSPSGSGVSQGANRQRTSPLLTDASHRSSSPARAGEVSGDVPVDGDTLFRVGSISKTVTWIAIMQLVEAGKVSLDDPVNAHLPAELRIPDEGFALPIRIRNLLAHNAGFEDATLGVNVTQDLGRVLTLHDYLLRYRVHRVRPAGALTVYSNYGAALAGAIVEHETGMKFADYAEARILRPLGTATMTFREPYPALLVARGFAAPMDAQVLANASSGFRVRDGGFVEQGWEFLPHMAPAGAMSASARDMAVYMGALLAPERFERAGVLKASTMMAMRGVLFANDARLGANRFGFWEVLTPQTPVPNFDAAAPHPDRWRDQTSPRGGGGRDEHAGAVLEAFGHNGGMAFQQTFMGIYPERGVAIFVASNTGALSGGGGAITNVLPWLIAKEFFGPSAVVKRARVTGAESAVFAGCYRPLRRPYHHTEAAVFALVSDACVGSRGNGDLSVYGTNYVPLGSGVYGARDGENRIAFAERDGRMMLFDFSGAGPSERVGYFRTAGWLEATGTLAVLVALLRAWGGFGRLLRGVETRAYVLLDGVSLLWLAAAGVFAAAAVPWLGDFSAALLDYPGVLLPVACWLFLAVATAAVVVMFGAMVLLFVRRPREWDWVSWTGAAGSVAVYGVFAGTLGVFGFLGFSGW